MTSEPNSSLPETPNTQENAMTVNGASNHMGREASQITEQATFEIEAPEQDLPHLPSTDPRVTDDPITQQTANFFPASVITLTAIALMILGLAIDNVWVGYISAVVALLTSVRIIWPSWGKVWTKLIPPVWQSLIVASFGILSAIVGFLMLSGANQEIGSRNIKINWEAIGALGELIGALGQILIAIIAVYVAWRQYVISRDLTIQQNRITQQQTIDAYFQGVSDLALGEQGLLEDWPQERVIAEGRTAAIIRSINAEGKAKVLRFLSQSKLITPLKRDRHLGRPILDGNGSYEEDRLRGIRVVDLGAMLAGADLANTDLRRTDLSEANLVRGNLTGCNLVGTNLSRSILYEGNLSQANLRSTKFFYGSVETATPRTRTQFPDYTTGQNTGAVVEKVDFTGVENLSEENRQYCCAWCGSQSRKTIPGGCGEIPNRLGR